MKKISLFIVLCLGFFSFAQAKQSIVQDSVMADYVGIYQFPEGSPVAGIEIAINEGTLTMISTVGSSVLEKRDLDVYTIVLFNGTARFNRDTNKKVIGISIEAMGYQLVGTKKETQPITVHQKLLKISQ